jgi:peptidoglycan/LPS O-acetylase OafA/YrhL
MPRPIQSGQRYMPGLDGLRALAVIAVITYHLGLGFAGGGLLGVAVFFTLSGYLITDLLLGRWIAGQLRLGEFWLRRARRLLPALFVVLAVVTAWVTLADTDRLEALKSEVGAASGYFSNWWLIAEEISYFARFGPPSPLGHLWSLAIEEQFYLLWPFLLVVGLSVVRERDNKLPDRPRLACLTLALAGGSILAMALLYQPGFDSSRVYYGTDTRAFGLLFGAALAMVWPSRALTSSITVGARRILDGLGAAGLVVIGFLIWRTDQYSAFLYPGGLVLLSVATVLVIAALVHPATRLGVALGWGPLRWLGVRSYGIYLWHFPIIVLTTVGLTGGVDPVLHTDVDLPRAVLQVAATIVLAALSWRFVEEPVRRGALGRLWKQFRSGAWRPGMVPLRRWLAVAAGGAVLAVAGTGLAAVSPDSEPGTDGLAPGTPVEDGAGPPVPAKALAPGSATTSCDAVVHIGDSTSEGLVSSDYLPNRKQRLGPQYAGVGATEQHIEISGATSIVETLPGQPNAYEVAQDLIADGYEGCWVLALGTNDTADVFVGSSVGLDTRIDRMMSLLGSEPVLWITTKSLVDSGPYSAANMELWNAALGEACAEYQNMRVYDWASVARDGWFIPDGIHYTSPGYAARGRLIAHALAVAFPAAATPPADCVVR